jgi:uncharacterized protein
VKRLAIWLGIMILVLFPACAAGQENPSLTVMGEGTVTVPADAVTIIVAVEGENENLTLAEERAQDMQNNLIDALKAAGLKPNEITPGQGSGISSFSSTSKVCKTINNNTTCDYESQDSKKVGKSVLIRLETTDQSRIDAALNAARSAGATAEVSGYDLKDKNKAAAQARKKAVENAKENALGMASAAGARLGEVLDISDYAYPIISAADQPGTVDVTSYVVATYEIAS